MAKTRVLVCITGASGAVYGVRLIKRLRENNCEVHLIVSEWGERTLEYETGLIKNDLVSMVDFVYENNDLSSGPASGSFRLDAMAIVPCSMKTLAGVAHGYSSTLIVRAADCSLKERKPLVVVPREAPYNLIHLRNMELVTQAGAVVLPASPAFWHKPKTIDDLVDSIVDRVLVHLQVASETPIEWHGESGE